MPGEPVPWMRPAQNKNGSRRTHPKDAAHRELVRLFATKAAVEQRAAPLEGAVQVHLTFCLPIPASAPKAKREDMRANRVHPRTMDVDNLAKAILDSLSGIAFHDDRQVSGLYARKLYSPEPHTSITVYALDPPRGI